MRDSHIDFTMLKTQFKRTVLKLSVDRVCRSGRSLAAILLNIEEMNCSIKTNFYKNKGQMIFAYMS